MFATQSQRAITSPGKPVASGKRSTPQPLSANKSTGSCACGGQCPRCKTSSSNTAERTLEREADSAAANVLSHHVPRPLSSTGSTISNEVSHTAAKLEGKGVPLNPSLRNYFEPRFGRSFAAVRMHTGSQGEQTARHYQANALTYGRNIAFAPGRYQPDTLQGRHLLAHELSHVVQQTGYTPSVQRQDESDASAPAEASEVTMTREQEINQATNSPGEFDITSRPLEFSLYNYAIDGHRTKPEHDELIAEIRSLLSEMPDGRVSVLVVGHTSETGSNRHNENLSRRRARHIARLLRGMSGVEVMWTYAGEVQPIADNTTASGRSRNRRTDIHLFPVNPSPTPVPTPTPEPPGTSLPPQPDNDRFFCTEHPLICLGIGGAGALLFCILNPELCLSPLLPDGPESDDDDGDGEQSTRSRVCVERVELPSGGIEATKWQDDNYVSLTAPFEMKLWFSEDDTGCECNRGEYLQKVRGFFEKAKPGEPPERQEHELWSQNYLHPTEYHEDGFEFSKYSILAPYGHRYVNHSSQHPRSNYDGDSFLEVRENGCRYEGSDSPGIRARLDPGERMRFKLDFMGAAVDRLDNRRPVSRWHRWTTYGDFTMPMPEPPTQAPEPEPQPGPVTPSVEPTVTPPYSGPTIGPAPRDLTPRSPWCFNDAIGCRTHQFMQAQLRQQLILSEEALRQAIAIEVELLNEFLPTAPPRNRLSGLSPSQRRAIAIRRGARERVLRHAGLEGLIDSDHAAD